MAGVHRPEVRPCRQQVAKFYVAAAELVVVERDTRLRRKLVATMAGPVAAAPSPCRQTRPYVADIASGTKVPVALARNRDGLLAAK